MHLSEILAERGNIDAAKRAFCSRKLNWSLAYRSHDECINDYDPTIPSEPPEADDSIPEVAPVPEVTKADIEPLAARITAVEASTAAVETRIVQTNTRVAGYEETAKTPSPTPTWKIAQAAYRKDKAAQ